MWSITAPSQREAVACSPVWAAASAAGNREIAGNGKNPGAANALRPARLVRTGQSVGLAVKSGSLGPSPEEATLYVERLV